MGGHQHVPNVESSAYKLSCFQEDGNCLFSSVSLLNFVSGSLHFVLYIALPRSVQDIEKVQRHAQRTFNSIIHVDVIFSSRTFSCSTDNMRPRGKSMKWFIVKLTRIQRETALDSFALERFHLSKEIENNL